MTSWSQECRLNIFMENCHTGGSFLSRMDFLMHIVRIMVKKMSLFSFACFGRKNDGKLNPNKISYVKKCRSTCEHYKTLANLRLLPQSSITRYHTVCVCMLHFFESPQKTFSILCKYTSRIYWERESIFVIQFQMEYMGTHTHMQRHWKINFILRVMFLGALMPVSVCTSISINIQLYNNVTGVLCRTGFFFSFG